MKTSRAAFVVFAIFGWLSAKAIIHCNLIWIASDDPSSMVCIKGTTWASMVYGGKIYFDDDRNGHFSKGTAFTHEPTFHYENGHKVRNDTTTIVVLYSKIDHRKINIFRYYSNKGEPIIKDKIGVLYRMQLDTADGLN